tara:strand:- start:462 stop:677 length:216 start_codon:yes stop_codon:yes gene_type:complete
LLVFASFLRAVILFITLDFPTLERPAKATSLPISMGSCFFDATPNLNSKCRYQSFGILLIVTPDKIDFCFG